MAAAASFADPPRLPAGMTLTAIGDVHGHADLMDGFLQEAEGRAARHPRRRHVVVVLGDMVDRGPDSAGVLERLCRGVAGCELVALRGNHEEAMLGFIAGVPNGRAWLDFGGNATLWSYGIEATSTAPSASELERLRLELVERLPQAHLDLLANLSLSAVIGDYLFVHAGLRPGVAIEAQSEHDL